MADVAILKEAAKGAFQNAFGAVLEIRADGAPPFYVDGRAEPPQITTDKPTDLSADNNAPGFAIWTASKETLHEIFTRKKALDGSYLSGRLLISGDMSIMARLILEAA